MGAAGRRAVIPTSMKRPSNPSDDSSQWTAITLPSGRSVALGGLWERDIVVIGETKFSLRGKLAVDISLAVPPMVDVHGEIRQFFLGNFESMAHPNLGGVPPGDETPHRFLLRPPIPLLIRFLIPLFFFDPSAASEDTRTFFPTLIREWRSVPRTFNGACFGLAVTRRKSLVSDGTPSGTRMLHYSRCWENHSRRPRRSLDIPAYRLPSKSTPTLFLKLRGLQ